VNQIFTEYVEGLAPSGEPPDRESFVRVWEELRRLLERELRRRCLWDAPPSYLGIYGRARWRHKDATPISGPGREDGLEELVAELYPYVFIDRLNKLVSYLRSNPTIDALVVVNARHLLHERQKKHDPLGYRVFEIFHQAVLRAVEAAQFFILKGNPRIRNDTVLGCRPDLDPDHLPPVPEEKVGEWNDVLLPELVEGKGKAREWAVASLQRFLGRLPEEGTEAFVFRDLLNPLKKDVRVRWAFRLAMTQGEMGVEGHAEGGERPNIVPLVPPDSEVEDRESLEKLDQCLAASFNRLAPDRTRDDLKTLWQDLRRRAQDNEIPSHRKLAEELNFPRRRLSKLFTSLGELVDDCRRGSFAKRDVMTNNTRRSAAERSLNLQGQAEALREQTGQARRAVHGWERHQHSQQRPRPGDVFRFAEKGDFPVEWLLLWEEAETFHAVLADISPLVGPGDVPVPMEAACGPMTLRCAFGLHFNTARLNPALRIGSLPPAILKQAQAQAAEGPRAAEDPELDEWIREVMKPAQKAARAQAIHPEETGPHHRPRASRRRRSVNNSYALAASLLLVTSLGLGGGILWQRQEILHLESKKATGNIPFETLFFSTAGGRSGSERLVLPTEAQEILLLLNIIEFLEEPFKQYRLVLLEKETENEIWRSERLVEVRSSNLTVKLPVRLIPEGDYLFQLYGVADHQDTPLAEVSLHIEYRP
jgi:hypothetical protein